MGAEFHRYASDVTCSFPADGKFSVKQRGVRRSNFTENLHFSVKFKRDNLFVGGFSVKLNNSLKEKHYFATEFSVKSNTSLAEK